VGPKKNDYRVKLKIGDTEVEVEGAESGVVKIVQSLSDVLRGPARGASPPAVAGTSFAPPLATLTAPRLVSDIRSFFEEKKPSSDIEAAAVAAYYYQYLAPEQTRRESIDSASLQEAFRMGRRPLPSRTAYTLINARNAGYLDSAGEGEFRLNPVGYNLVEHGLGSSRGVEEKKAKQRRRLVKKKKKKRKVI
jgi:hypothetical protein